MIEWLAYTLYAAEGSKNEIFRDALLELQMHKLTRVSVPTPFEGQ